MGYNIKSKTLLLSHSNAPSMSNKCNKTDIVQIGNPILQFLVSWALIRWDGPSPHKLTFRRNCHVNNHTEYQSIKGKDTNKICFF